MESKIRLYFIKMVRTDTSLFPVRKTEINGLSSVKIQNINVFGTCRYLDNFCDIL